MTDIDRAIKLLASPIEADRRKAIKLLAEMGTTEAYEYIGVAYKSEQDPDIRALMVKAGKYIKAQQARQAQAVRPTPPPPTKPPKSTYYDTYDATSETTSYATGFREQKEKNKYIPDTASKAAQGVAKYLLNTTTGFMSTKVILSLVAILNLIAGGMLFYSLLMPWVKLDAFRTDSGITLGEDAQALQALSLTRYPAGDCRCLREIDARITLSEIADMLDGGRSGWGLIFGNAYTSDHVESLTARTFAYSKMAANTNELDQSLNIALFSLTVLAVVFGFNTLVKLAMNNRTLFIYGGFFTNGGLATTIGGLVFAIVQQLGYRLMWLLSILATIVVGLYLVYFYFSTLPRFMTMVLNSFAFAPQPYHLLGILDSGYLMAWLAIVIIMISNGYAIARYGF